MTIHDAEYVPDGWILLEPGRVFLYPFQSKRTWRWSLRSRVGSLIAEGKAKGYYGALEAAKHAAKHADLRHTPKRPDPGMPYEAEAYAIHLIPTQFEKERSDG